MTSLALVENLWNQTLNIRKSCIEIQNIRKQNQKAIINSQKDLCDIEILSLTEEENIFRKCGRLFIKSNYASFTHNLKKEISDKESCEIESSLTLQKVCGKLSSVETDLNELMESDPLYCVKRAIARTVNQYQRLKILDPNQWLVYNNYTEALSQQGPTCGMVSLVLVARFMGMKGITVTEVLELTREMGFTRQGEMFSADWMADTAQVLLPSCSTKVENVANLLDSVWLLKLLRQGGLILIPYDCAANSSICLERGHKAHWGIITGVLLPGSKSPKEFQRITGFENYHLLNKMDCDIPEIDSEINQASVKVIVRQSKSLELEFYSREKLVESCKNLLDVAKKRQDGSYILPENGISNVLSGKIVTINKY